MSLTKAAYCSISTLFSFKGWTKNMALGKDKKLFYGHFWRLDHSIMSARSALNWGTRCFSPSAEMVFCYQNCSDLLWEKIVLVIERLLKFKAEGREFEFFCDHLNNLFKQWKVRTISGNRMLFNLFLEISKISKNRTIIIQIGKNYWDLEICRKS